MTGKIDFGKCGIAVIAVAVCIALVSCSGGDDADESGARGSSAVITDIVTQEKASSANAENITLPVDVITETGGDLPVEDIIAVSSEVSGEPDPFDGTVSTRTTTAGTKKPDAEKVTTTAGIDTTAVTSGRKPVVDDTTAVITTKPLIEKLPDGGFLLPDDEWD